MLRAFPRFSGIFLGAAVALAVGAAGAAACKSSAPTLGAASTWTSAATAA